MSEYHENDIVIKKLKFTSQETILLKSLQKFYSNKKFFNLISDIINGDDVISRRTIEYFVTCYSLSNRITYQLEERKTLINFNVYSSYKDQLKAYKKKYFDPFGRGIRIPFFSDEKCIITTIGQLNFYRWFFTKKIYDYCLDNYEVIQTSLLSKKKTSKDKKTKTNKKKSNRLDYSENKRLLQNKNNLIISFNI